MTDRPRFSLRAVPYWDVTGTGFFSILIIALGLSADCFAVSLAGSVSLRRLPGRLVLRVTLAFGLFQAGMTLLGWLAGSSVTAYISPYDHWLAFGLLIVIGGHMLWESFHTSESEERRAARIASWPVLFVLAVATSIDALAAGLSFAFLRVNIALASLTIGLTASVVTIAGLFLGRRVGALIGRRAEMIGGVILIGIGLDILIAHLV